MSGAKYRKTALVQAEQFLPNKGQVPAGVYSSERADPRKQPLADWMLNTLEGPHVLRDGDYICTGPAGEQWNVERSIFEATYEIAPDHSAQQDSVDVERLRELFASMPVDADYANAEQFRQAVNKWWDEGYAALSLPITQRDEQGDQWQDIAKCEGWRYDFQHPMLAYWTSRGVCETYWHVDEDFDDHPSWWTSPREGWRAPGDQCIPVNQDSVTHWQPMPAPPSIEQSDQDGGAE